MTRVVIVDTNVPIVANGDSHMTPDCQTACITELLAITRGDMRVAVDDGGRIVDEYGHKLRGDVQGVGHEFVKWIYAHQWDERYCDQVTITQNPESAEAHDFVEFPSSPALKRFDPSDRKFVAVAAAHPSRPRILEAADSKWVGLAAALETAGVRVEFLCLDELKKKHEAKHGE
jgi:hypothetical protein